MENIPQGFSGSWSVAGSLRVLCERYRELWVKAEKRVKELEKEIEDLREELKSVRKSR